MKTAERLTLREVARRLDRDPTGLGRLVRKGIIPKGKDGKFDEAEVRAAYAANTDPAREKTEQASLRSTSTSTPGRVPDPIAAQATAEAQLATTRVRAILAAEGVVIEADEPLTFNHARTADKIVQTWERDRAHAEAAGRMLDAETAGRRWADEMVKLRAQMLAISGRVAMELSHLTAHEIHIIDRVVRDVMTEVAGGDEDGG